MPDRSAPRVLGPRRGSTLNRFVRRLARPALAPIDGRVGDIRRRVDNAQTSVERHGVALEERLDRMSVVLEAQADALEAYARSSQEASSYVGAELRGLRDACGTVTQRSFEEYHQARLAQAMDLPLDQLDDSLAEVINYAGGHRGFYAQAGLWFNPPVGVALGAGIAVPAIVNERIVELPFAMAALSRLEPGARILDIGGSESTFSLSAASLGYLVTAIDPRPLSYAHPNLESFTNRVEDWEGPSESFAAAFLISTIEHIGLGAYGEGVYGSPEHGKGADRLLLDRVRRLLGPGGVLVLTTPYGTRAATDLERIYDQQSLSELLAGWEVLERRIVVRRDSLIWEPDAEVAPDGRGVVMVLASARQLG